MLASQRPIKLGLLLAKFYLTYTTFTIKERRSIPNRSSFRVSRRSPTLRSMLVKPTFLVVGLNDGNLLKFLLPSDNYSSLANCTSRLSRGESEKDRTGTELVLLDDIYRSHSIGKLIDKTILLFVQGDELVEHKLVEPSFNIALASNSFFVVANNHGEYLDGNLASCSKR